jgi:hypothetical protein
LIVADFDTTSGGCALDKYNTCHPLSAIDRMCNMYMSEISSKDFDSNESARLESGKR